MRQWERKAVYVIMSTDALHTGSRDVDSPIEKIKRLVEQDHKTLHNSGSYSAALIMTALPIPVIAALASATLYISLGVSGWSKLIAILGGASLALLVWLIATICFYHATSVDRANMSSYQQIINRLYQLAAWIENNEQQDICQVPGPVVKTSTISSINRNEVRATFDAICTILQKQKNSSWMWAIGYVNIWRLIHRVDEALINIEPEEEVIRDAIHDEMSIMDSKIDNRNDLLNKLRLAVKNLSVQGAIYLKQQPPDPKVMNATVSQSDYVQSFIVRPLSNQQLQSSQSQAVPVSQGDQVITSPATIDVSEQARTIIREVRFSLHQFRDDRWERLVRVRNHLMRITILTGLAIYLLVAFVIMIITPTELPMLEGATVYYLVGVLVSLFSRLYDQSKTDSSIDDFRLASARLIAAPIFSGLAAVGGVLIVTKLAIIQTPTTAPFELNLANVIVAAVFGLTPSLFITTFQKQADQYKADLKSTQGSTGEQEKTLQ
jgi:hypothetical protein